MFTSEKYQSIHNREVSKHFAWSIISTLTHKRHISITQWQYRAAQLPASHAKVRFLFIVSGRVMAVLANEQRRYICNVFTHWLRTFSHDLGIYTENGPWPMSYRQIKSNKNNKHPTFKFTPKIRLTSPPLVSSNHAPLHADSSPREISTRFHLHCYKSYEKFAQ